MGITDVVDIHRILFHTDGLLFELLREAVPTNAAGWTCGIFSCGTVSGSVGLIQVNFHFNGSAIFANSWSGIDLGDDLPTRHIDVSCYGHKRQQAMAGLVTVLILVQSQAPGD